MSSSEMIPVTVEPVVNPTPMHLIQMAMAKDFDIDKLERLLKFQQDSDAKVSEQLFHAALSDAQSEIGRVATDAKNNQTGSKYATYAALDRAIRPVYTRHGFGLSFSSGNASADTVDVYCNVSHSGGHVKTYMISMPCDGKGAKGNDVMTKTHAMGSAMSYGMRYLLKMIFNVAVGEDDDDGNKGGGKFIPQAPPWTEPEVEEAKIQLHTVADLLLDRGVAESVVNEAVARSRSAINSGDCSFGTFVNRLNGMCGAMLARHQKSNPDASAL